ncbi:undecaprenyl/decaprenyl-phosphate alpha-N-acetylglucosaminyl 1-phosphate transferase [Candidatus Obscuribacterales bacterium]|nr:undecaprenyl/decaprenyl-phosphate alpha-N-acetylglucosaminyl 1-phosphate transferase [Candidatus Obscuribacterales bacterium]
MVEQNKAVSTMVGEQGEVKLTSESDSDSLVVKEVSSESARASMAPAGGPPSSAQSRTTPQTAVPPKRSGRSMLVRSLQLALFLFGLAWAAFYCPHGHLDAMQIPGFLIAMSISWWLTPEIRSRALNLGLVDKPGEERRIHKVPIPRLGGVAIFISILITVAALIAIAGKLPNEARRIEGLAGIAVGGTLVFVLGLLDDLESLRARMKFIVQILAACAAYSLGVRIKSIPIPANMNFDIGILAIHGGVPIELGWFSLPITVLWLVGVANAVNLIDGMDGLAAGVSAISALTIWSVALGMSIDRPYAALIAAILAGALFGFLRWNFNPARIFLGDSGAYLVGFILGAISITGVIKGAAAATVIVPTVLLVVLILFFPLLDTSWAIVRRMAARRSIFSPDAGHIHHRLLRAGFSQKKVAYLIYGASGILGLIAAYLVDQHWYFLSIAGAVLVMAIFFAEVLNKHRQRGKAPSSDPDGPDTPSPSET